MAFTFDFNPLKAAGTIDTGLKPHIFFGMTVEAPTMRQDDESIKAAHMKLLTPRTSVDQSHETLTTPLFTMAVMQHANGNHPIFQPKKKGFFTQYALLGGIIAPPAARPDLQLVESSSDNLISAITGLSVSEKENDIRLFYNVGAPSSTFICGSQGSGKSHTLSCLLESCLISSVANILPNPLSAVVFHYDTFVSDDGGSPCEAAWLSSSLSLNVRVLCSPTNLRTIRCMYARFKNISVEPLRINETDLNTKRMLDLMVVNTKDAMPLYLHTIMRILKGMRMEQQEDGLPFNYWRFKSKVLACDLTPAQLMPLHQRLDTLESFMPIAQTIDSKKRPKKPSSGTDWSAKPGHLTIVDLSCPCVTAEAACALFNTCLGIFLEVKTSIGKVIALDEAHKYMDDSAEADTLTGTLLSTIRLQRHQGTRIIISTQEPTVSPALLDLSSMTIVHRFTSPNWLATLKSHLAGVADDSKDNFEKSQSILQEIVKLQAGEALLFSPSAMLELGTDKLGTVAPKNLGSGYVKIRIRERLTDDGGRSVMAL